MKSIQSLIAALLLLCGVFTLTSAQTLVPSASPSIPKKLTPVRSPIKVPVPVPTPVVAGPAPVKVPTPVAPTTPTTPTVTMTPANMGAPPEAPIGIEPPVRCGLLNLGIFCLNGCGLFRRLLGIGLC